MTRDARTRALATCLAAIELEPNNAKAHSNLGIVLLKLGNFGEAAAACRRAVELDPDLAEAHNNLGFLLLKLGEPEEALANLRRAVKLDPEDAKSHGNLGVALGELGRFEEARASLRKSSEIEQGLLQGVLGEVAIVGAFAIDETHLRRMTDLLVGESLADGRLQIAQKNIEELYRNRGFSNAQVTYEISNMGREGFSREVFKIAEGAQSLLRNIKFIGNSEFSDRELHSEMRSSESGTFDPIELDEDLITIERMYHDKGVHQRPRRGCGAGSCGREDRSRDHDYGRRGVQSGRSDDRRKRGDIARTT